MTWPAKSALAKGYGTDPDESAFQAGIISLLTTAQELPGAVPPAALPIASGAITPTTAGVIVDTEGGLATDDLTTINTTTLHDGAYLLLRAADASRVITVRHGVGVGAIALDGDADVVLSADAVLVLRRDGSSWREVRMLRAATAGTLDGVLPVAKGGTGATSAADALTNLGVQNLPVGTIFDFPVATPPTGALVCDGSARSRTAYAALFGVIGTTYGAGDGSATFNLPDLRGEFRRGADLGRGVDAGRAVGSAQGDLAKVAIATRRSDATINVVPSWWTNATRLSPGCDYASSIDSTQTHGGSETRPRNVAVTPCIKY